MTVINEYYGWYLIQFGDQVGYVAADFVAVERRLSFDPYVHNLFT